MLMLPRTTAAAPPCRLASLPRSLNRPSFRHFRTTAVVAAMVKAGDSIPSVELAEGSPGNKVNLADSLTRGLIIGVPAAFSPGCTETHIPGYIASPKTKAAGDVYVVSVNDVFVMKAWAKSLDPDGSSGMRFLADATGQFTKEMDMGFDATKVLGGMRSRRYAIVVEGGKVKSVHVEPENTPVDVSAVDKVLP